MPKVQQDAAISGTGEKVNPGTERTKIRMMVELEYDGGRMNKGEKRWFMENVLLDKNGLLLHSNEIGDTIGTVHVLEVDPFRMSGHS